jgi:nucleoside-diphosphate-sugar epimerase
MNSKLLITGENGFLAQNMINFFFNKNYDVFIIVRNLNCYKIENSNKFVNKYIKTKSNLPTKLDSVIHCAGEAHSNLINSSKFNEEKKFTKYVIDLCIKKNVKSFFYISSAKVNVDFTKKIEIINEHSNYKSRSFYANHKLDTEQIILRYLKNSKINSYIFRLPLVIGPNAKGNLLRLYQYIKTNLPIPVINTNNKRSFISTNNLNLLIHKVLTSNIIFKPGTFLICNDEKLSTLELIKYIKKSLRKKSFLILINPKFARIFLLKFKFINFFYNQNIDNSKAKINFNWQPDNDVKNSLNIMLQSYKKKYE